MQLFFAIIMAVCMFPYSLGVQQYGDLTPFEQWMIPDRVYEWSIGWCEVETERGVYNWLPYLDANGALMHRNEFIHIIQVKCTPEWAREWEHAGAPPRAEYWDDYTRFVNAVIARYKPIAVEIYNEVDMRAEEVASNTFYGAWVGPGETWEEGGARYGAFCAYVVPQITGAWSVVGALTMHGNTEPFLQAAVDSGLTGDFLSYHAYVPHTPKNVFFSRPFDLEQQLEQITDIPLIITETAVLTRESGAEHATDDFLQAQVDYLEYVLERLPDSGIRLVLWFNLANGDWYNCSLVEDNVERPVYELWRNYEFR